MGALDFISGYGRHTSAGGRVPLLLLILAFVLAFALTRLYTRLARARGWGSGSFGGGMHLHHMVVGILMILLSGLLEIALRPGGLGRDLVAIAFGIGAALTLDEFALWLYLRDVYWSPEGRSSIDASVIGILLAALLLVGSSPFGLDGGAGDSFAIVFGMAAANLVFALVTFFKGKLVLGLVSVFVPLVGPVCAWRLAKPGSLWAKWFYGERKLRRAHARFDPEDTRVHRLRNRFDDLVGGSPDWPRPDGSMQIVDGCLVMAPVRGDERSPWS